MVLLSSPHPSTSTITCAALLSTCSSLIHRDAPDGVGTVVGYVLSVEGGRPPSRIAAAVCVAVPGWQVATPAGVGYAESCLSMMPVLVELSTQQPSSSDSNSRIRMMYGAALSAHVAAVTGPSSPSCCFGRHTVESLSEDL